MDEQLFKRIEGVSEDDLPQVDHGDLDLHSRLEISADHLGGHTRKAGEKLVDQVGVYRAKRSEILRQVLADLERHLRAQLLLGFSVLDHEQGPLDLL